MPILDIQRRGQQIGRIRIGEKVATGKTNRAGKEIFRPVKLATFRLTTGSRLAAVAVAEHLGGEVREWGTEWEVVTTCSEIPVTVPPRDQAVSQWYEMWTAGGCARRCDSVTAQTKDGQVPCLCPSDPHERAAKAKQLTPEACKPVTRINVMIPDLPGLGVWRLDTGSFYAATELGDAAELMERARANGVFLPATLRIDQRTQVANGLTKQFPVPVLEIMATFREIATGAIAAGGLMAQLPPAPGQQRLALTAGPAEPLAQSTAKAAEPPKPQDLANQAMAAVWRGELAPLIELAKEHDVADDMVCTDAGSQLYESLRDYLTHRWAELPAELPVSA